MTGGPKAQGYQLVTDRAKRSVLPGHRLFTGLRAAFQRLKHRVLVRLGLRPRHALTVEEVAEALRQSYPATVIADAIYEPSPFLQLCVKASGRVYTSGSGPGAGEGRFPGPQDRGLGGLADGPAAGSTPARKRGFDPLPGLR